MLAEKLKLEKDQNAQLRRQVAQLVQLEQDHESKMEQQNSKIETLQVGWCSSDNLSIPIPSHKYMPNILLL